MSMDIYVLSDSRLGSISDWQIAINGEGFPLRLSDEVQLETARGFLPADLRDQPSGFECYHDDVRELMGTYGQIDFGQWRHALGFRTGSDIKELLAAWMAATAYARAANGVVFDPQESKIFTPQQALDVTRNIEKDLPSFERAMREFAKKIGAKP
jgi:hypothetical protein